MRSKPSFAILLSLLTAGALVPTRADESAAVQLAARPIFAPEEYYSTAKLPALKTGHRFRKIPIDGESPAPFHSKLKSLEGRFARIGPSDPSSARSSAGLPAVYEEGVNITPDAQDYIFSTLHYLLKQRNRHPFPLGQIVEKASLGRAREEGNADLLQSLADLLLQDGKISIDVYRLLTAPAGDDAAATPASSYLNSLTLGDNVRAWITNLKTELKRDKKVIFNTKLNEFDRLVEDYRRGSISFETYVRHLASLDPNASTALDTYLLALDLERSVRYDQAVRDQNRLLKNLLRRMDATETSALLNQTVAYRLGGIRATDYYGFLQTLGGMKGISFSAYPALSGYIRYLYVSDALDPDQLFTDVENLERRAYNQLARSKSEKILIHRSNRLYQIERWMVLSARL